MLAADINIVKFVNGLDADTPTGPHVAVGSTVTFTYVVTNTGDVPLANVAVTDDKLGAITSFTGDADGNGQLDLTETWTYATTATALAGQQSNVGTVTAQDANPPGTAATDDNPANYFGDAPGINIVKFVNGQDADTPTGPHVPVGSTVTFTYVVTNTGNVPLANVAVTDDKLGTITSFTGDTNGNGMLDLTETWTYATTATALAGQQSNVGTVTAQDANPPGTAATDDNPANYFGDAPGINIVKFVNGQDADTPTGPHVPVGSTVTFTYVVTNTGNVPLANVAVTDDKLGGITSFTGDTIGNGLLDLTETWIYTTTATALAGQQTNVGMVTGQDANNPPGTTVTDDNPANYFGDLAAASTTTDVTTSDATTVFGEEVTFTATVTSTLTPTGTVTFVDTTSNTTLGTVQLDASGIAVLTVNNLSVGSRTILATFNANASFSGSSDTVIQTISQASTTTSLQQSLNPSSFGQSVTFTATVSANAPSTLTPVGSVTFFDDTTGMTLGTVNVDAQGMASVSTSSLAAGDHTIEATFTNAAGNFGGSIDMLVQTVQPATPMADLAVDKTGPATVPAGQNITYSITLSNNGPVDAQNVVLTDAIPTGTTAVSFAQTSGPAFALAFNGTAFTASATTFTAAATATFLMAVTAEASNPNGTIITNTASVTTTTSDPTTGNNSDSVTTTVQNTADLVVTKSGEANVFAGENITYTITVTNNGPVAAQNVVLTDTVPANTTFVGFQGISQGSATESAGLITANFGTVAVGSPATLTFVVTTDASTPNGTIVTNTATATSDTLDPNTANNTGSETTQVATPGLPDCEVTTLNSPRAPGTAMVDDDADNPGENVLIVTGTSGNDVIVIEPQPRNRGLLRVVRNNRVIVTFISQDVQRIVVFALAGNDKVVVNGSMTQSAILFGDAGNDYLYGARGADGLEGGSGTDRLFGGSNNDTLCGGDGNDFVYGQSGNDFAGGDAGNDKVFGEAGNDFLLGNEGNDHLYGGTGNDRMYGQAGNDQVFGASGNDIGVGGDGNDKLFGGSGRDVLIGGVGLDLLFGETHDDILVAGSTTHDEDDEALQAILAEWTSANSYTDRVNNIRNGGGQNGAFTLDDTTVSDDGVKDTLYGDGGLDWFLFGDGDKLKDKAASELVN